MESKATDTLTILRGQRTVSIWWRPLSEHRNSIWCGEQRTLHLLPLIWMDHSIQVQGDLRANYCPSVHFYQPTRLVCREPVLFTGLEHALNSGEIKDSRIVKTWVAGNARRPPQPCDAEWPLPHPRRPQHWPAHTGRTGALAQSALGAWRAIGGNDRATSALPPDQAAPRRWASRSRAGGQALEPDQVRR
jgi:hypothetical protein